MKRYWLFAGRDYYPFGGMSDFRGIKQNIQRELAALEGGDSSGE